MNDTVRNNQANFNTAYEFNGLDIKPIHIDTSDYQVNQTILSHTAPRKREETDDWLSDNTSAVATSVEESAQETAERAGRRVAELARYVHQGLGVAGKINDLHNIGQHAIKGHGAEALTETTGVVGAIGSAAIGAEFFGGAVGAIYPLATPAAAVVGAVGGAILGGKKTKEIARDLTGGIYADDIVTPTPLPFGTRLTPHVYDTSGEPYSLVQTEGQFHWYSTRLNTAVVTGAKKAELAGIYAQAVGFEQQVQAQGILQARTPLEQERHNTHHAIRHPTHVSSFANMEEQIKSNIAPNGDQIDLMYAGSTSVANLKNHASPTHIWSIDKANQRLVLAEFNIGEVGGYRETQMSLKTGTTIGTAIYNAQGQISSTGGYYIDHHGKTHNPPQTVEQQNKIQAEREVEHLKNMYPAKPAEHYNGAPDHYTPPKTKSELEVEHLRDMYPPSKYNSSPDHYDPAKHDVGALSSSIGGMAIPNGHAPLDQAALIARINSDPELAQQVEQQLSPQNPQPTANHEVNPEMVAATMGMPGTIKAVDSPFPATASLSPHISGMTMTMSDASPKNTASVENEAMAPVTAIAQVEPIKFSTQDQPALGTLAPDADIRTMFAHMVQAVRSDNPNDLDTAMKQLSQTDLTQQWQAQSLQSVMQQDQIAQALAQQRALEQAEQQRQQELAQQQNEPTRSRAISR